MRLVIATGPQAGRAFVVEQRTVAGRDEGCDLVLEDDEKVSRRHCAFSPNPDGTLTVEDVGSSNGTFVAGVRIAGPVVLRGGEEVRVGSTVLRVEAGRAAAATVVGPPVTAAAAPATTVGPPATLTAEGPPPAGPPPGSGRPWWRSRWALIGAAAALLAIGGIVGGVLAVTGGDDDEPVAVVTTDGETSEPETVTVTESVETEPPPETETGGAETGVTGSDGLTPSELELLAHVPEPLQATCQGYDPATSELVAGRVAGLSCPTSDGIALYYDSYDSVESMNAAYAYVVGDLPRDEGDCSAAFPAEGTYTVGDAPGGRIACFEGDDPVAPVIWWTTDALGILAYADWPEHADRELYEFWTSEPGPNP